jgi:hypothetical protein
MVELRSCYFCGAVGDSLREYEVVPERLVSDGGARTAVLCSSCHEKLRRVVEPLAGAAGSASASARDDESTRVGEVTFETGESAPGPSVSSRTTADPPGDRSVSPADTDEGATNDADEPESDGTNERDPNDADEPGSEEEEGATDEPSRDTAVEDVPDAYYKVLRLLQNREFPMERAALTSLVTGAYDVSPAECDRILETAIDRGVLVEDGSTLDLGRN